MEARGTGCWVVDRVSVDRVRSKSGSGVDRSGQNPGQSLTGSGQKSGLGSDRVRDDVSIRFDRVKKRIGAETGSGQVTGSG